MSLVMWYRTALVISHHFSLFLSYGTARVSEFSSVVCFWAGGWQDFTVWAAARNLTHSSYCTLWRCCKWWKRLLVFEALAGIGFQHSQQNAFIGSISDILNPNHLQISEPLVFFLPTSPLSSASVVSFSVSVSAIAYLPCSPCEWESMAGLCSERQREAGWSCVERQSEEE